MCFDFFEMTKKLNLHSTYRKTKSFTVQKKVSLIKTEHFVECSTTFDKKKIQSIQSAVTKIIREKNVVVDY